MRELGKGGKGRKREGVGGVCYLYLRDKCDQICENQSLVKIRHFCIFAVFHFLDCHIYISVTSCETDVILNWYSLYFL